MSGSSASAGFEQRYISLRQKEQRVYTPEQIALLPDISPAHPHSGEWQVRKRSCNRLLQYLRSRPQPLTILECGCGNGWLSARLATLPRVVVTGSDVNQTELEQAQSVFQAQQNLSFQYGDLRDPVFDDRRYNIIVFAASVQYFPSLQDILRRALSLLRPGGEVHLVDTHFYRPDEVAAARERTHRYYSDMGFPEMSAHYFHHQLSDLEELSYKILFDPRRLSNRILHHGDPFYWLAVRSLVNK